MNILNSLIKLQKLKISGLKEGKTVLNWIGDFSNK